MSVKAQRTGARECVSSGIERKVLDWIAVPSGGEVSPRAVWLLFRADRLRPKRRRPPPPHSAGDGGDVAGHCSRGGAVVGSVAADEIVVRQLTAG